MTPTHRAAATLRLTLQLTRIPITIALRLLGHHDTPANTDPAADRAAGGPAARAPRTHTIQPAMMRPPDNRPTPHRRRAPDV